MIDFETIYWIGWILAFIVFAYSIKDSNTEGIVTALFIFPFLSWAGVIVALYWADKDRQPNCGNCEYSKLSYLKEVYCTKHHRDVYICNEYKKKEKR